MKKRRTTKDCPIVQICIVCEKWVNQCDTLHMRKIHNMPKAWGGCPVHGDKK